MSATIADLLWDVVPVGLLVDGVVGFELVARPGVPGAAILWDAVRTEPQAIEAHRTVASAAEAAAYVAAVRRSMRTSTTYTDPLGRSWPITILRAAATIDEQLGGTLLVRARWLVLPGTKDLAGTVVA